MRCLANVFALNLTLNVFSYVPVTNATELEMACGDLTYKVKTSWFQNEVRVLDKNIERPYCVSDSPDDKTSNLVIKDDEIWCIENFFISADRQPYAKSSTLLDFALKQVFEYDYVWQHGDWKKIATRISKCPISERTKRQKVLDNKKTDS